MQKTSSQNEVEHYGKILWDYMQMHHTVEPADGIIVLCTYYLPLAKYATQLFKQGVAPWVLFTGKGPVLTEHIHDKDEAEAFADAAIAAGMPAEHILLEKESRNSEQNIVFTKRLLAEKGVKAKKVIVVCKPYFERRAWAIIRKHWPEVTAIITSPPTTYKAFMKDPEFGERHMISLVATIQRMKEYPKRGFQIAQPIPVQVWEAYEKLIKGGYQPHSAVHKDELQRVPGIGPSLAADLRLVGVHTLADLRGKNPRRLYDQLCVKTKSRQDPCVLYAFRCAVYYASSGEHDPAKLKWWYWKDRPFNE